LTLRHFPGGWSGRVAVAPRLLRRWPGACSSAGGPEMASLRFALALLMSTALSTVGSVYARGPIGRPGPGLAAVCEPARCPVAETIAASCPCDAALTHRNHVRCVSSVAKGLVAQKALPRACKPLVVKCALRSTCGSPERAACRFAVPGGGERCGIRRSTTRCAAAGGTAGSGSCCAVCTTSTTTTSLPGSSTTSSTSSSTTSSTTTTTLLPCGGIFPACLGSCPPGQVCTAAGLALPCVCTPTGP